METKQEIVQPQRLLEQVMKELEEEAGVDSIEEYATTTFGDELIRVLDNRGEEPDVQKLSGSTYEQVGVPAQSFHKGKDAHETSALALASVIGSALENPEFTDMLSEETEQQTQSVAQTNEVRFTDY